MRACCGSTTKCKHSLLDLRHLGGTDDEACDARCRC
eukprot:SAG25_NODE_11999_length_290_cov_0.623037_1_plen_35_part_10